MGLRPCGKCRCHVRVSEVACPFCGAELAGAPPRAVTVVGRVTRAAIFSAALAGCTNDKPKPTPAPAPAQGSDDLEKLLDHDGSEVVHPEAPPPIDASIATTDAAPIDAGVPTPDAGVVRKKRHKQQQQQQEQTIEQVKQIDQRHMAKPYGAPPARRRIV